MPSRTRTAPNLRALLIGINCYLPNKLSDGTFYLSLKGCVRDALLAEELLRSEYGLTDDRLIKLTATDDGTGRPSEPREHWPSYRNIVSAFRKLTHEAEPGDVVYIHYSGHGGRTDTLPRLRKLLPNKVVDETLVPTDLGNSEGQYLRDLELAFMLRQMVIKGLLVTVVLDSCHAGSATRGNAAAPRPDDTPRGLGTIDHTPRPSDVLVASDEELAATWPASPSGPTRDLMLGSGWLLEPEGYVLLAACRANEVANEFAFDGLNKQGALTYWLVDSLRRLGPHVTYRSLHRRVLAKVYSQFKEQTPQLEGEGDRLVFGSESKPARETHAVMGVEADGETLTLNAGLSHGLARGAAFYLYPLGESDAPRDEARLAVVELTEPGATTSRAKVVRRLRPEPIGHGDAAVMFNPGPSVRRPRVRLLYPDSAALKGAQAAALYRVEEILKRDAGGFIELVGDGAAANFLVSVNSGGYYQILDPSGAEVPGLRPLLNTREPDAPERMLERLIHLARFWQVRALENDDPATSLAGKLSAELTGVQAVYVPGDEPRPRPFEGLPESFTLKAGEWTFLRVRNGSASALNVTVLNLRPDWSIRQVFPSRAGLFETIERGREILLPFRAALPPGHTAATDLLKIFATVKAANFRSLELPQAAAIAGKVGRGAGQTPDADTQACDAVLALEGDEHWAALQLEIRVET